MGTSNSKILPFYFQNGLYNQLNYQNNSYCCNRTREILLNILFLKVGDI